MSQIDELKNIPDISFTDGRSLDEIRSEMMNDFAANMQQITGEPPDIATAHPIRLLINAVSLHMYAFSQMINKIGKSNFLKYAEGAELDNLGALKKVERLPPSSASTTIRFSMSDARSAVTSIPSGTRVCTAQRVYFQTTEYVEIPAGQTFIDVPAIAVEAGESGNGYAIGAINTIVDPLPYVSAVTNTIESSGGTDIESDDNYTRRIYLAPASYSSAGPVQAYEYFVKQSRSDIIDQYVYSPSPNVVNILFMLEGGFPSEEDIAALTDYLSVDTIRPITDNIVVSAPVKVDYSVDLTYYISKSDSIRAVSIQVAVEKAIVEYQDWQRKIGRNINPSELIHRIKAAGAHRVEITSPTYTIIDATQIAVCSSCTAIYGGLEDD